MKIFIEIPILSVNNGTNLWITSAAIATLISALVAAVVSSFTTRKNLLDSLDSKSGWRKNLFEIASKTYLDTDDVYTVLAALRFVPSKSKYDSETDEKGDESSNKGYLDTDKKGKPENFQEMSSLIYYDSLKTLEDNFDRDESKISYQGIKGYLPDVFRKKSILNMRQTELLRLYVKYLLKHHWEDLGRNWFKSLAWRLYEEEKVIQEVIGEREKILKRNDYN